MQRLCCKTTTQIILLSMPYYVILHAQIVPMEFVHVSSFKVTNVNEGKYLYFIGGKYKVVPLARTIICVRE